MKVIESIRLFVVPTFAGMTDVKVYVFPECLAPWARSEPWALRLCIESLKEIAVAISLLVKQE